MKKPESLRETLTAALDGRHHIRANPDRLDMTAIDITLLASGRPGAGFGYRYTLQIVLMDFAGAPEEISVPLMLWIERYQHDLVASAEAMAKGVVMTVKFLDSGKSDILIDLQLTEIVRFSPREGGGHDVVYVEESVPMALQEGSLLHAVYLDDELIAHCEAHPTLGN